MSVPSWISKSNVCVVDIYMRSAEATMIRQPFYRRARKAKAKAKVYRSKHLLMRKGIYLELIL